MAILICSSATNTFSQIFPSRIRELGTSTGVATQWLFNFVFSLATPYMIASWGSYTFLFYACLDIIMSICVYLFFKETKGRTLEEMEHVFRPQATSDNEAMRRKVVDDISEDRVRITDVIPGYMGKDDNAK